MFIVLDAATSRGTFSFLRMPCPGHAVGHDPADEELERVIEHDGQEDQAQAGVMGKYDLRHWDTGRKGLVRAGKYGDDLVPAIQSEAPGDQFGEPGGDAK